MSIGRRGWRVTLKNGKEGPGGDRDGQSHAKNLIKAVRSRKTEDLNAPVNEGHYSAALCHLANISMRIGRRLRFDTKNEKFIGDDQANTYLTKEYRKGFELPKV